MVAPECWWWLVGAGGCLFLAVLWGFGGLLASGSWGGMVQDIG